jgi:hypothetical protein
MKKHVIHAGGEFLKKTVFIMDVSRGTVEELVTMMKVT